MAESQSESEVRCHLDAVCASTILLRSQRSQALLRYLVDAKLAGKGPIKEYTIGVDVFARGEDFDPKSDSIVRTEANRLRAKVQKYYQEAGRVPLRIEMTRGEYSVQFIRELPDPGAQPVTPVLDAATQARPDPRPASWLRFWPLALALTLAIGIVFGWVLQRGRATPASERILRSELLAPPDVQIQSERGFAISQDGRMIAYVAASGGVTSLWVRPLESAAARNLPGTAGARDPFWSPDNRDIAYAANGKLWRIDANGGATPVVICDAPTTSGGTWAADGTILYSAGKGGLRRVAASGGPSESFTVLNEAKGETSHRWPQIVPGPAVLFHVLGAPAVAGTHLASLHNPAAHVRLHAADTQALYADGHLLWLRDSSLMAQPFSPPSPLLKGEAKPIAQDVGRGPFGRLLVAVSGQGPVLHAVSGGVQLTWVNRSGNPAGVLGPPGGYLTLRQSPDGGRVAVSLAGKGEADLWILDAQRGTPTRLTSLPDGVGFPVWSPDGAFVLFRGGPSRNIFRKNARGSGEEQTVTSAGNPQWPGDWSRDGQLLFYQDDRQTKRDMWVLAMGADGMPAPGAAPVPYLRTPFNEFNGRFSPEPRPRWVAYQSDESGSNEVYVQAFPNPRGKWRISTQGGSAPEWNPNGREIFYVSSNGVLTAASLTMTSDSVAVSSQTPLFPLPDRSPSSRWAVSRDGQQFLIESPSVGSVPIQLVVNWQGLLR